MRSGALTLPLVLLLGGCQELDRFDTSGDAAYRGSIVGAQFVRTPEDEGGFKRELLMCVELDTDALTTTPGTMTTDDAADGPCAPLATFDNAPIRAVREVFDDPLSTLRFSDAQEHNVLGWVESTCRGPMLAVVSLMKSDDVEVRLLKPPPASMPAPAAVDGGVCEPVVTEPPGSRAAFALFKLGRQEAGCSF